jgi:hypothetical protein
MTTGEIFLEWLRIDSCVLRYQKHVSQECVEFERAALDAVSVMIGFIFVLLNFCLAAIAVKPSSIKSRFGGAEQALEDNFGFCEACLQV